jgi:hypothetical protein
VNLNARKLLGFFCSMNANAAGFQIRKKACWLEGCNSKIDERNSRRANGHSPVGSGKLL